jgi:type II secretory pathway pseudopilin PulG
LKFHFHRINQDRGAVAVEFALIASLLVMLIFGIVEFGTAYSQYQVFQNAARQGARAGAVRGTSSKIDQAVSEASAGYELSNPPAITVNDSAPASDPPCDDTSVGEDLKVSWNQVFTIDIPFLPDMSATVNIRGVFRCE